MAKKAEENGSAEKKKYLHPYQKNDKIIREFVSVECVPDAKKAKKAGAEITDFPDILCGNITYRKLAVIS